MLAAGIPAWSLLPLVLAGGLLALAAALLVLAAALLAVPVAGQAEVRVDRGGVRLKAFAVEWPSG